MTIAQIVEALKKVKKPLTIMEVCGTHTSAILKAGIRNLLPDSIRLVSGPGCPVCVTGKSYIDALIAHAYSESGTVYSFGDLLRVPGSNGSLMEARARGASVEMIYSPLDCLTAAQSNPDRNDLIAAVGFETTAPVYAVLLEEMINRDIRNIKLLTALKTMPAALSFLCERETVDGFLCPGHVSAVTGSAAYESLCERYKKPFVIAGFEGGHILAALYTIVRQIETGKPAVANLYPSVVSTDGQQSAQELLHRYFEPTDAIWRGIGLIKGSGLVLRKEYARFDAGSGDLPPEAPEESCRCGDVMLGRIDPPHCPMFGTTCTPAQPVGACMVSAEGACGIWQESGVQYED